MEISTCPRNNQYEGIKDDDLLALLDLKNLRHLVLAYLNVSFDEGVLPILEKFGRESLEVLELRLLDDVNIAAIVRHCSNLRSLTLDEIEDCNGSSPGSVQKSSEVIHEQLPFLEYFAFSRFNHDPRSGPTAAILSLLFRSCPALVKLDLNHLYFLTDQVIEEAARAHGFPKLEMFSIYLCQNIRETSVDLLLSLESPIKKISIKDCKLVSKDGEYVSNWQDNAEENDWDLSMSDDSDLDISGEDSEDFDISEEDSDFDMYGENSDFDVSDDGEGWWIICPLATIQ